MVLFNGAVYLFELHATPLQVFLPINSVKFSATAILGNTYDRLLLKN